MTTKDTKSYITLKPVALGNDYHDDGVRVELNDKQAEFLLASGAIKLADEVAKPAAKADASKKEVGSK